MNAVFLFLENYGDNSKVEVNEQIIAIITIISQHTPLPVFISVKICWH